MGFFTGIRHSDVCDLPYSPEEVQYILINAENFQFAKKMREDLFNQGSELAPQPL